MTSSADVLEELAALREDLDDGPELVATDPADGFELWMQQLDDRSESTIDAYHYRVSPFLEFLDERDVGDLNDLTTRHVKEFESERRAGDRCEQTLSNQFKTLKLFLAYCEELDAVHPDVVETVDVPALSTAERVNTEKLVSERAGPILDELERFRYASTGHVVLALLWETTMRVGALRSLDVDDCFLDESDLDRLRAELRQDGYAPAVVDRLLEESELPFVYPRHRPESDTPLKNGEAGERVINLVESTGTVLEDYLRVNRVDVLDEHDRRPLLTSAKGADRLSASALRSCCYVLTQPCEFGGECPHDRDPETCEAREHGRGSRCPSSRSPHRIRTGSITHHRDRGWPISELADKANTSEELIHGVYDQPEAIIRGASRRQHVDRLDLDE